jgi:hypothetical protein
MKEKIFAEVGIGNQSFFSTEIEGRSKERRIRKFILPKKIRDFYIRVWISRKEIIFSLLVME